MRTRLVARRDPLTHLPLGSELGEPDGDYEETNSSGWDMVPDLWAAAQKLFGGG